MPLFFFHYRTANSYEVDTIGGEFASLELAYLDAHRGVIDIAAELLRAGKNPMQHCIDVADAEGRVLMDLPFREVLLRKSEVQVRKGEVQVRKGEVLLREGRCGPDRKPNVAGDQAITNLRMTFARSHQLRAEINTVCDNANATLEVARSLLQRAVVVLQPRPYMLSD